MNIKQFTPPQWLSLSLDRNKFVCFFFYSFFLLFFLSPDSYLYDVYNRCDSAWFFMCGKAWMNGLVPYVDFADSKGPLLWLIYGVGYLLNSHSYVGVFWVSCVFYAVSFTFAYKICRLYLDRRGSVLVLALLPLVLFYKRLHYEVRAEDFCNTFIFIALYSLCCILKGRTDKRQLFKYAFAVGASMTCCLLIKWNYFFMIGGMALVVLFISIKKKTLSGLWGGLVGIAVPAIPFLAYFLIQGNFEAFITEYFINVAVGAGKASYISGIHRITGMGEVKLLVFVGAYIFCYNHKGSWGILFSLLVFLCLLLTSLYAHYYNVLTPFGIFLLIVAVEYVERKLYLSKRVVVVLSLVCIIGSIGCNCISRIRQNSVFVNKERRQSFYDVSLLMATIKNPKVMSSDMEQGVGVLADALPASRYWACQSGATKSMLDERRNDLQNGKADFLVLTQHEAVIRGVERHKPTDAELNRLGYVYCGSFPDVYSPDIKVYCKKELYRKLPPVKLRTIDLLLKRDILSGAGGAK